MVRVGCVSCSEGGGVCGEGVEDECAVKGDGCVVREMSVQ